MKAPRRSLAVPAEGGAPRAGAPSAAAADVLVLGIGNLLLGDEGVGVHVVRRLEQAPLPPGVAVLDGGTGGLHLLSCFTEHPALVVLDATIDGRPPGSVTRLQPRFASDYPRTLVAHDIGLKDLVDAAQVLGVRPRIELVTVSIGDGCGMSLELSAPVAAAVPQALRAVHDALDDLRAEALGA
jgi:hydrogenase maturation protease